MGVGAGFGVLVVLLGVRLLMADDFLMFVLPMIGGFLVLAGGGLSAIRPTASTSGPDHRPY